MPDSPPDVVRRYAAAMAAGDRPAAFAHYADDVVIHTPGRSPLAGVRRGREEVGAYIDWAFAQAPDGVEIEVVDTLTSGDRVALVLRERVRAGGRHLDIERVNVYRVRDGHIAEIRIYEGDQHAVDAFFGDGRAAEGPPRPSVHGP